MTVRLLVARYGFSKENHHRQSNIRIIVSLAVCMAAMLVILSAMHALSDARLNDLRTYETFDLQVLVDSPEEGTELAKQLSAQSDIEAFVVAEEPALLSTERTSSMVRIRYLDPASFWYENLSVEGDTNGWMCPTMLSWKLGIPLDGTFTVSLLREGKQARVVPRKTTYLASGLYSTPDEQFDAMYLLAPLEEAPEGAKWFVAVVTDKNPDKIRKTILSLNPSLSIQTWKELNSSLYGALMLEQTVVRFVFLILLVIILLSVRRGIARLVGYKRREIGTLLSMGMEKPTIIRVFLEESLLLCLIGLAAGFAIGLLAIGLINRMTEGSMVLYGLPKLTFDCWPTVFVSLFVLVGSLAMALSGMHRTVSLSLMEMLSDE